MLPLTLVLLLLMRMDNMLLALRSQRQNWNEHLGSPQALSAAYMDYYDTADVDAESADENLLAVQQLPAAEGQPLSDEERLRRCISFNYRLSEGMDQDERDIMKYARTSFLPKETTALPRECLDLLPNSDTTSFNKMSDYNSAMEYMRSRLRRAALNNYRFYRSLAQPDKADEYNPVSDPVQEDDEASLIEPIAGLASFWNEQGTKESVRAAQARTMLMYMDNSINPCDDFYKYACGNWEKLHPIPKDKAGFDTFEMLRENLDLVLKQLLENDYQSQNNRKSFVHTGGNSFEQKPEADVDIVAPAGQALADSKLASTHNDNSASSSKTSAAAVLSKASAATKASALRAEAERLRKHIVSCRSVLGHILQRYQREITYRRQRRWSAAQNGFASEVIAREPAKAPANPKPVGGVLMPVNAPAPVGSIPTAAPSNTPNIPPLPATGQASTANLGNHPQKPNSILDDSLSAHRKAKDLYHSCIDSRLLAKRGVQPLMQLIDSLGGWPVLNPHWNPQNFDWLNLTAQLRRYNNDILIVQWVGPDIKDSDENVIQFDQTSLGLPTREYFLQEANLKYLQAYQHFMAEVMHKLGAPEEVAQKTADELIAFETRLASITSPAEMRLNVTKLYKRTTLKDLHAVIPEINWMRYLSILQQRSVRDSEEVVIYATEYMHDLVGLLAETQPNTLANYLLWRFVRHRINNVDDRFEETKQNFYHALFGREESPSRWKVCIAQVNTNMGMALGSMFVTRFFDENSKRDTLRMTHELQQAFRDILKSTDWLDGGTKNLAEQKVNAMSLKIGYPDFILNPAELNEKYVGIEIHPDMYFENTLNVLLHTARTEQSKLHEAVNKTTWQTAPAIVNAYYSRNKNQIMFPAGILQPPFYHRNFPRSLNFGGIGVVIGHELTHGFDDKGRLFDKNGSIHKWWSDTAIRGFDERARCIIAQYSNYTVDEVGISLNGESTQGENIADNGGIRQAFHAYKRWLRDNPNKAGDERLPGINMSGEQLFFLNFGQVWCGAMRPEAVRNKLNTAIHSPGRFRVIGTLSNSEDFAREYRCPRGSPMNPVHKCSVW